MDEQALLAGVAAGDTVCFERLYSLYERRIFQYIRTFVRDLGVAEELVVDSMLAVWDGARRFNRASRVSTWIFGIARHKALDAVRRASRGARRVDLEQADEVSTSEPAPEEAAEQRELHGMMEHALGQLSPEHREILYLAFYADLPYDQIAILLSLPVNTVKTRVYYAKQNLRGRIERHTFAIRHE